MSCGTWVLGGTNERYTRKYTVLNGTDRHPAPEGLVSELSQVPCARRELKPHHSILDV